MTKKIVSCLLLFMAIFVFATWQYRLLSLLLLAMVNKKWLKSRRWMNYWKYSYRALPEVGAQRYSHRPVLR